MPISPRALQSREVALPTALPWARSPWQTGEERLLLQVQAHRAKNGPGIFSAWCQLSPTAVFYNQGNKQPCTLGRGASSLHGCLPWMNGHNPLNNERLLCLCLSFWQGCSFQVLLISTLLATLRVSIVGWPSQLQFCMFSTSQGSCDSSRQLQASPGLPATVPGPTCRAGPCLTLSHCAKVCMGHGAAQPRQHNSQPSLVSSARASGCCLGPQPQTCPEWEQCWVIPHGAGVGI